MKTFFIATIIILSLFALCMLVAYALTIVIHNSPNQTQTKTPPTNGDAKIYYITNYEKKRKSKPRTKKEPSIALKGTVIKPEQFEKIFFDSRNMNESES